jgi:hypothetical protein
VHMRPRNRHFKSRVAAVSTINFMARETTAPLKRKLPRPSAAAW